MSKLTTIVSDLHARLRRFAYIDALTGGTNLIDACVVTAGGSGYTGDFAVTATGGGGSGFAGTAVVLNGSVVSITVDTQGSAYTSTPTLDLSAGDGSGATATAVLGPTSLDAAVTTNLLVGHTVYFEFNDEVYFYELVSSTAAESSPDQIRPDDYAASTNEKVWFLRDVQHSGNFFVTNPKATTASVEYPFAISSNDASSPFVLRSGLRTHATAGSRWASIDVDDAGTPRTLCIQPGGGLTLFGTDNDTVTAAATVHIVDATEQLRLGENAGDFWSFTVSSSGTMTMYGEGDGLGRGDLVIDCDSGNGDFTVIGSTFAFRGNAPGLTLEETDSTDQDWRFIVAGGNLFLRQVSDGGATVENILRANPDTSGQTNWFGSTIFGDSTGTATPAARIESLATSGAQLRLSYDGSNYWTDTVASDGGRTLAGFGSDADLNIDFSGATDGDFTINSNLLHVDTSATKVGINLGGDPVERLHVLGNFRGEDNQTNSTTKFSRFVVGHYTNAEEPLIGFHAQSNVSDNWVSFGGGSSIFNAVTRLSFYAAANTTTLTGTEHMRLDGKVGGRLGVGITSGIGGKVHIDQTGTTDAISCLYMTQQDVDYAFMLFNCTVGTGNAIEAVGAKSLTTTHFIKVRITGGLDRYIPIGTIA